MDYGVKLKSMKRAQPPSPDGDTTLLRPIRLTDQITRIIKEQIFNGDLRPGERVVEQKFARQFGVGQNAIREALIELAHLGFVRRVPNKGTYVTEVTPQDAVKIARVRRALEGLAIELILERMATEKLDISSAAELLNRMRQLLKKGDMEAFYQADVEFHRRLWALAGNEYLSQMLEQIVVPLFAFFIVVNLHPHNKTESILEAVMAHERIVKAIEKGSVEQAKARMNELLDISLRFSSAERAATR
jgi:DNA-binding GntR family transcriptional regulator